MSKTNDYFNKLQSVLASLNKIPIIEMLSELDLWKAEFFFLFYLLIFKNSYSVKKKLFILSQKTEKDEISSEILEEKGIDLIFDGNKLIEKLEKLKKIPLISFKQSVDEIKLKFNELLIKSIESNFYQIHLPNLWESINFDNLFNDIIESSDDLFSKKELSISVVCQDKKSQFFVELDKGSNSIDYLSKSPLKSLKKNQNNAYLSLNQNDISYDSVKTVKKNLSSLNIKDGVKINDETGQSDSHSNYYPLDKLKRKSNHDILLRPTSLGTTPQLKSNKKHSVFEKNIMNKQSTLAKLKIPEKYKAIFDELKNDRLEQVDLSNAGFF